MTSNSVSLPLSTIYSVIDCLLTAARYDLASDVSRKALMELRQDTKLKKFFQRSCWECSQEESDDIEKALDELRELNRHALWEDLATRADVILQNAPRVSEARYHLLVATYKLGKIAKAQHQAAQLEANDLLDVSQLRDIGELFYRLGYYEKSCSVFKTVCMIAPGAVSYANLGAALLASGRKRAALVELRRAVELNPNSLLALNNLAAACLENGQLDECERTSRRALRLDHFSRSARANLGNALLMKKRWSEAAEVFEEMLRAQPIDWDTMTKLMYCLAQNADWTLLEDIKATFREKIDYINSGKSPPNPWVLLSIFDDPELHQRAAHRYAQRLNTIRVDRPQRTKTSDRKINIGYFSADFYNHPTTQLILGIFSHHDRERFAVHAFSFGPDTGDAYLDQVRSSVDHFYDVSALSSEAIALKSREKGIDIAVDLNGYTKNHRASIFSHRAAPIQVGYLGYPGTLMLDSLDYVVADVVTVPEMGDTFFSEKVLRLPRCYQVNSFQFDPPKKLLTKFECGLPEQGVILACFNSIHKIQRETFLIWLDILKKIEGSVLWLYCENSVARENIEHLAKETGVDASRIIWAERLERPQHLSRHRHIDVYLDTWPYNAHTTASDALRMGVPIVTLPGHSFASRVCASLLVHSGLRDLVAQDCKEYLEKVVRLCQDPLHRAKIAAEVRMRTHAAGVFSAKAFTKDLEACFLEILNGEVPTVS